MSIQRYSISTGYDAEIAERPNDDGYYVIYADHLAALAAKDAEIAMWQAKCTRTEMHLEDTKNALKMANNDALSDNAQCGKAWNEIEGYKEQIEQWRLSAKGLMEERDRLKEEVEKLRRTYES